MNEEKFDEYIKTRYGAQVEWYDKRSIHNKWLTYSLQIPTIILAAVTPILAALEYTTFTIISSLIVAAGLGVLQFCKFESLWHRYRTTCETLKKEKVHHDMLTDVYAKAESPDKLFVERVESIISGEHTRWVDTIGQNKEKDNTVTRGI